MNFEAAPNKFPTDRHRIYYAIGNIRGIPRTRIRNVRQSGVYTSWLETWPAFINDLRRVYGDPDPVHTARHRLLQLRQRGPVADHAAEFLALSLRAKSLDPGVMIAMFERSLNDRLRERMALVRTDNIKEYIREAINLKQRLRLIRERDDHRQNPLPRQASKSPATTPLKRETDRRPEQRVTRPPLPPRDPNCDAAEKIRQHRRAHGKCYGCGGDHLVCDCPSAAQTQGLRAHALVVDQESGDLLVNPLQDSSGEEGDLPTDLSEGDPLEN